MLTNYLKVAWRNLHRNKMYSAINIFGLGLGIAVGFVILYWVNNEYNMNGYHSKSDRIYQVIAKMQNGDDVNTWENIPAAVTTLAKENIPDVGNISRMKYSYGFREAVKVDDKVFIEDKYGFTENDFFKIFTAAGKKLRSCFGQYSQLHPQ